MNREDVGFATRETIGAIAGAGGVMVGGIFARVLTALVPGGGVINTVLRWCTGVVSYGVGIAAGQVAAKAFTAEATELIDACYDASDMIKEVRSKKAIKAEA